MTNLEAAIKREADLMFSAGSRDEVISTLVSLTEHYQMERLKAKYTPEQLAKAESIRDQVMQDIGEDMAGNYGCEAAEEILDTWSETDVLEAALANLDNYDEDEDAED